MAKFNAKKAIALGTKGVSAIIKTPNLDLIEAAFPTPKVYTFPVFMVNGSKGRYPLYVPAGHWPWLDRYGFQKAALEFMFKRIYPGLQKIEDADDAIKFSQRAEYIRLIQSLANNLCQTHKAIAEANGGEFQLNGIHFTAGTLKFVGDESEFIPIKEKKEEEYPDGFPMMESL